MKTRLLSLLPALVIACAGIVILCRQRADMIAMRDAVRRPAPAQNEFISAPLPAPRAVTAPPAAASTTGEERAAAFLAGLSDKARPLIEKAGSEAAANRARLTADRATLLIGLSAAERDSLLKHLEKQDGLDDKAAQDWISAHGRADQLAAFDAAESARRSAEVEHQAQEAIFRLSRIVDLTPEQKDRLYAGFVSKSAAAPAAEPAPMELRTAFTVSDTPQIPDPRALARPLLTPEQLAFYNAALEQEAKVIRESSNGVMGELMPVLMSALQEAAAEKE